MRSFIKFVINGLNQKKDQYLNNDTKKLLKDFYNLIELKDEV